MIRGAGVGAVAEATAAGIWAMPVICDNPDWWVVKIIGGFSPHTSSLEAMEVYVKHKILLVKEEGAFGNSLVLMPAVSLNLLLLDVKWLRASMRAATTELGCACM